MHACRKDTKVVSDAEWRKNVLGVLDEHVQDILIDALSTLLFYGQDKRISHLPHYIADLCEMEKTEERRRVLFFYVVNTSLASDTVSAVHRLLRGNLKSNFVNYVKEYRLMVESMHSNLPSWVVGKLRGLMANMHIL